MSGSREWTARGSTSQAVSPSPVQYYWAKPELGAESRGSRTSTSPGLWRNGPTGSPVSAACRCSRRRPRPSSSARWGNSAARAQLSTSINGVELGDPRSEPFWEAAEHLGAVIFLHPLGFSHGDRFREFYMANAVGHPLESALALSSLVFEGVLARRPGLKIVVAHGGGYLPFHSSRLDHAWEVRPECRKHIDRPPSEYLKQVYSTPWSTRRRAWRRWWRSSGLSTSSSARTTRSTWAKRPRSA